MINVYHSAFKISDAGLLIWFDGIFIFWTYHTPHMISVFLCSRILGTLICIWNNGCRYSICCFTILHTAISLSYRCLRHIWMLSQICRESPCGPLMGFKYHVPICDMGYFSITIWGGTSTFLDGYLGSNLQM